VSSLSTHVLDSATGRPAEGMAVTLWVEAENEGGPVTGDPVDWLIVDTALTDADGRIKDWKTGLAGPGDYRLQFATARWFAAQQRECFYPEVTVAFTVKDDGHYHVPLLLAPFAYSTYRGS
jgi:5-hydroxyisourate hydrolase